MFTELQADYDKWVETTEACCVAGLYNLSTNLMFELGLDDDDPFRTEVNNTVRLVELNSMPEVLASNLLHNERLQLVKEMGNAEFAQMGHDISVEVARKGNGSEAHVFATLAGYLAATTTTEWSMEANLDKLFGQVKEMWRRLEGMSEDDVFNDLSMMIYDGRTELRKLAEKGAENMTQDDLNFIKNLSARAGRLVKTFFEGLENLTDEQFIIIRNAMNLTLATEFDDEQSYDPSKLLGARFIKLVEAGLNGEAMV